MIEGFVGMGMETVDHNPDVYGGRQDGHAKNRPDSCPNCGDSGMTPIYELRDVPIHSMILLRDPVEAQAFPTGTIRLAACGTCGFVTNTAFDPALERYGADYEASQSFSPTFNTFHERLAEDLVSRHDLAGRSVLEIGCGQGEFLHILAHHGANPVYGFDPAYRGPATQVVAGNTVHAVADFFTEASGTIGADFVCCKQTLEHIPDTFDFVHMVRRAIGDRPDTGVFFQVPDFQRIVDEGAFWDVYYEHCSYFTQPALVRLFEAAGFEVQASRVEYDGQYLMIEARPTPSPSSDATTPASASDQLPDLRGFAERCARQIAAWRTWFDASGAQGLRTALWGGGSKAVAFLTSIGAHQDVTCAFDVNPRKAGTYLPQSACPVMTPEALDRIRPDQIVVMNPIYMPEIRDELAHRGHTAELIPVTHFAPT
ncbi:C-methyltransferase C-terminal domain-containing protein [Limimonas halophila]|uniref:C-methyltransferase C-terminal domain-containing protein n=1 Tax=Limimonas halophila TaxID=1082479 RepID=A0A1G7NR08_9PROT|nr:class I SAM-dependent methyltransferase [Limimonas halophila]SDF76515.1 C-methyltransferase C-terminal domain-containing protein [Limimonas halophila]